MNKLRLNKKVLYILTSILTTTGVVAGVTIGIVFTHNNTKTPHEFEHSNYSIKLDENSIVQSLDSCDFSLDFFDENKKPISILSFFNNYNKINNELKGASHNIFNLLLINTHDNSIAISYGIYIWGMFKIDDKNGMKTEIDNKNDLIQGKKVYSQSPGEDEMNNTSYHFSNYEIKNLEPSTKYKIECYMFDARNNHPVIDTKYKINEDNDTIINTKPSYTLNFSSDSSNDIANAKLLMGKYNTFSNYEAIIPKNYYLLVTYFDYSDSAYDFAIIYSSINEINPNPNNKKSVGTFTFTNLPVVINLDENESEIAINFAQAFPNKFLPGNVTSYRLYAYLCSWVLDDLIYVGSIDSSNNEKII